MTHTCPDCGMSCICDMEDHESDAPDDCCHECADDDDEDVDIGVVGCFHQYIIIEGVLKCAACNHDFYSPLHKLTGRLNSLYELCEKVLNVLVAEEPEMISEAKLEIIQELRNRLGLK